MKVSTVVLTAALSLNAVEAFAPFHAGASTFRTQTNTNTILNMAMDVPPAATAVSTTSSSLPEIRANPGNAPVSVRYSDFLKLVNADRIEKVTFSADGTQLLGVDSEGVRIAIEALPNDPDLLSQLTSHKVDVTVLPTQEAGGLGELAQSLIFPLALFAGLFFLSRRAGGGGMGPMGGPGNPMGFGKSKAQIQMVPDTGVTFDDVGTYFLLKPSTCLPPRPSHNAHISLGSLVN